MIVGGGGLDALGARPGLIAKPLSARVYPAVIPIGGSTKNPMLSAFTSAKTQNHVIFLENFFDELRRKAPVVK